MIYSNKFTYSQKKALKTLRDNFFWSEDQLDYLIACMMFESNCNPQAINKISKAIGLIQFMPATCKYLNVDYEMLKNASFETQLIYVQEYFKPYYKRTRTLNDMYMAILMPKFIGYSDDTNIFSKEIQYRQNIGLDLNKDGIITKAEACNKVRKLYEKGKMNVWV